MAPRPLPRTRFLRAGRRVYKFKIRYGRFPSAPDPSNTPGAAEELEEAIRVILANLDDLHPFSTDHFTVFPYLRKWERAWKMRFTHGNVNLVPYPYVCTLYLELNSFLQHESSGTEGTMGREELNSPMADEGDFNPAALPKDWDHRSDWAPEASNLEQRAVTSLGEGAQRPQQQLDQTEAKGSVESAGGSLSQLWRSIIIAPLQHLFGGKN